MKEFISKDYLVKHLQALVLDEESRNQTTWSEAFAEVIDIIKYDMPTMTFEEFKDKTIKIIHEEIYKFFDVAEDGSEEPITDKDIMLLEVNKGICTRLKELSL